MAVRHPTDAQTTDVSRVRSAAHRLLSSGAMSMSDRTFRGLARSEPQAVLSLVRAVAPGILPAGAHVTAEMVDDPHIQAPPITDADWVARVEPGELLHVECQGYRDDSFPSRLFRYHLGLVLRYPARRVRTIAVWLTSSPAEQRPDRIDIADGTVRVTSVRLARISAERLLEDPDAACFAPGADAGSLSAAELCRRVALVLAASHASYWRRHMALVAAITQRRYKEMVIAMEEAKLEPVISEDLVRYGFDQGIEEGREEGLEEGRHQMARQLLLEVFEARGFTLTGSERIRVDTETSLDRLRAWHRSALSASSVAAALV